jgi:hypothetical protein
MKSSHVSFVVALALCPIFASGQELPGNPLNGLDRPKDFETRRISSSDSNWKDGNNDARPIPPGETLTLAELDGPGKVVHIWITIAHGDPFYSRKLTLRMYWDGEEHPSVECPVGDSHSCHLQWPRTQLLLADALQKESAHYGHQ